MNGRPVFRKYHGLGNDYLIVDPAIFAFEPLPDSIRALCDRHRGPGADGVLVGPFNGAELLSVRIFNPDGSEAEKSGNGARIFARYLMDAGYATSSRFSFFTKGGPIQAAALDAEGSMIRLDMGEAAFDAATVALSTGEGEILGRSVRFGGEECRMTCVSMGNPHCVVMGLGADEATARRVGPLIETDALFPARTNVQFLEVRGPHDIAIAIWERGAGYTLSSGSSSCAAAAAARRLGLAGDEVTVHMAGGDLNVAFKGWRAFLTGPVAYVYEGLLAPELAERLAEGDKA